MFDSFIIISPCGIKSGACSSVKLSSGPCVGVHVRARACVWSQLQASIVFVIGIPQNEKGSNGASHVA